MGSHQFQMEYIEYLQARNLELVEKLSQMKENYENKICSENMNKHYFSSGIQEILNLCTALPQEIDLFFDEMTTAMNTLKSILLKKSEMVQLVDKISQSINPTEIINEVNDVATEQKLFSNTNRKSGTVKVSPMINGHVISTGPRIYLNRVSKYAAITPRNESPELSPIVETSPVSSDTSLTENHNLSNPTVLLEKINFDNLQIKSENQATPKHRFKRHSSWRKNSSEQEQRNSPGGLICSDQGNKNDKSNLCDKNDNIEDVQTKKSEVDPLEGPSWLYNNNHSSGSQQQEQKQQSDDCFVDFKRRKHRFAAVFDREYDSAASFNSTEKKEENLKHNESDDMKNTLTPTINEDPKKLTHHSFSPLKENSNIDRRSKSPQSAEFIEETPKKKCELKSNTSNELLIKQPIISLQDCTIDKSLKKVISRGGSSPRNKSKKSDKHMGNKSSPIIEGGNSEGRKRRKAAPTNLSEPSLITKLRRS